ncbi:hypothetical protein PCH_Pc21g03760 [Penicillium rubens Wisconsin 54-1255]|uniref:Uncharacterized protein n=1 Tax=Penicillium rubens (strain ATCC 28089 / DSM 1075 / NRRL 1951 / Wisconsin 54-1255) TaxID=500485 RepID=B6HLI6_PENRW|nr:hypothetical protein PCH_Pc21g03760 [Penicillium rubens Wisconsin 54-1255]
MATSRLAFTMPKGKCISCERSSTVRGLRGNRYHEMRRIIEQSVQWGIIPTINLDVGRDNPTSFNYNWDIVSLERHYSLIKRANATVEEDADVRVEGSNEDECCGLEYYADYCSVRGKKAWSAVICTVNWMETRPGGFLERRGSFTVSGQSLDTV